VAVWTVCVWLSGRFVCGCVDGLCVAVWTVSKTAPNESESRFHVNDQSVGRSVGQSVSQSIGR